MAVVSTSKVRGELMGRAATGVVVGHDEVPPSDSDAGFPIGRMLTTAGTSDADPISGSAFTVGDAVLKDDDVGVRPARCSEPRPTAGV